MTPGAPPKTQRGWARQFLVWLLVLSVHVGSYAQVVRPILWGPQGAPHTGFTANGTFLQNGIVTPNPHQGLHTLMNISVWTIAAFAMSNTTDPSFTQPSLADMAAALSLTPEQAASQINTIYIGPNPYANAAPPNANTAANASAYDQVIADYVAYGGSVAATQTQGSLSIFGADGIMNTPVFQAALPGGKGAAGVTIAQTTESVQNADAVANFSALQAQNSALLGSPIYYSRTRVDLGGHAGDAACVRRGDCTDPALQVHQALFGAQNTSSGFELGYIQANGQAHAFDLASNRYFSAWNAQTQSEWQSSAQFLNQSLALNLGKATGQHIQGQQAASNLNFAAFEEDRALFMQGIDLYGQVASPAERATLDALRSGALRPGDTDYENARALAQRAFSQAWAQHVEFDTRLAYNRESAHYQAQHVQLDAMSEHDLFASGLNLYGKGLSQEQEQSLRELQGGRLEQGSAAYEQARALADAQWRAAYEQSLMPPPKKNWFKQLAGVVLGVVAAFFVGPLVAQWLGAFIPGATATATVVTTEATMAAGTAGMTTTVIAGTAGTTLTVGGAIATGLGSAVGSATSAFISTGIATGSMSKGFKAAGNALQGGLVSAAVSTLAPGLDITSGLGQQAVRVVATAAGATARGGSFGQNLLSAGLSEGMQSLGANAAHTIGDTFDSGSALNYAAHAGLGCVSGSVAARSSSGCASGAAGAVVGDWAGQQVYQNLKGNDPNAVLVAVADTQGLNGTATFFAGIAGGAAASIVGNHDQIEQNFSIGQSTSQNAFENNYLQHQERQQLREAEKDCYQSGQQCDTVTALKRKDELSDQLLANAAASCKGAECAEVSQYIQAQAAQLGCPTPAACPDRGTLNDYWRVSQAKAQGLEPVYPESWLLDAKAAYDLGKWGIRALSASGKGSLEALEALNNTPVRGMARLEGSGGRVGANGGTAAVEPIVTAKGTVNGSVFEDVNQTAKIGATNEPTLIANRVAAKTETQGKPFPNGTVADSHAEIGVIQQAYNAGKTQGSGMSMTVSGKDVCGYCKGDIAAAADAAGLKSLTVQAVDNVTGLPKTYYWQPGMKSIKEKP